MKLSHRPKMRQKTAPLAAAHPAWGVDAGAAGGVDGAGASILMPVAGLRRGAAEAQLEEGRGQAACDGAAVQVRSTPGLCVWCLLMEDGAEKGSQNAPSP